MAGRSVTIVDYGMGNIRSLARAFERAGASVAVTDDPQRVVRAERLVIPGQGAFGQAMDRLTERGLIESLQEVRRNERPLLGICLGLQLLYASSEEAPEARGLSMLSGHVRLLPLSPGYKRPNIGWAPVHYTGEHPVLSVNKSGTAFYFVHSYAVARDPQENADSNLGLSWATSQHSIEFTAAIAWGSLVATQFHPEKSQAAGANLLAAWLSI